MTNQIKKDTIERAYGICKRYARLSEKFQHQYCDNENRKKYYCLRDKLHDATWRVIAGNEPLLSPSSLVYSVVVAAVDNGKGKEAVYTALEAVGIEII
jgi:hypothetical protein